MAMIKCPECGHQTSDKAQTCPSCGIQIAGNIVRCSNCGEIYFKDEVVCPHCHTANAMGTTQPAAPQPEPQRPAAPQASTPRPKPTAPTTPTTPSDNDNGNGNDRTGGNKNNKSVLFASIVIALLVLGVCFYVYNNAQNNREQEEYEFAMKSNDPTVLQTYLDNYKAIWDLYITDSTIAPTLISSATGEDAAAEFAMGDAVFYQNGTWAYNDCIADGLTDEELGMLPIYIGAPGEENQGLCTGSENYWCVNKNASEADIQATLKFLNWCITSDVGRSFLANTMGLLTPFKSFDDGYMPENPLVVAADEYIAAGKTPVSWDFLSIPSVAWKNGVGSALTEYAEGKKDWKAVEDAFIIGWETEYAAAHTE